MQSQKKALRKQGFERIISEVIVHQMIRNLLSSSGNKFIIDKSKR